MIALSSGLIDGKGMQAKEKIKYPDWMLLNWRAKK